MRQIWLILLVFCFTQSSVQAFFSFKRKPKEPVHVNEEFTIQGKYQANEEIFDLRIAVYIPRDKDEIAIQTYFDEVSDKAIRDIVWIAEEKRITSFKKQDLINKKMEEVSMLIDPSTAYDRITENKHVVNRTFFYKKVDVLGNNEKKIAHFLELDFVNGWKKNLRIDSKLYAVPTQFVDPVQVEEKKPEKTYKPNPAEDKALELVREEELKAQEAIYQRELSDVQDALGRVQGNFDGIYSSPAANYGGNFPGASQPQVPTNQAEFELQQQLQQIQNIDTGVDSLF